jgi:hypothetical protein
MFAFLNLQFYVYHTEELVSERSTGKERECEEREEDFCRRLTAPPE